MGIESLYADDIEAGIQRQLLNPTQGPGSSFRTTSFVAAGVKGVPRAGLEVGGSALDVLAPAAAEVARRPRLKVLENQPDDRARVEATAKFVTEGGDVMREEASTFAPDPATAHTADQVLHGFTRVGTKVVAATAVGNLPTAATLLAAEGTNTAYHELVAKGIDPATALKAGAVEGLGQAAAVIPMAGPTIKATVGLGIAAGPGAFMAQETLSRKILAEAGYKDEASRHDPLDPLGLTIATLLPAVFGGAHAVGLARARPTLADVVLSNESGGKRYGADGALLTSPKGAQGEMQVMPKTATDPGYGVVPAKDGSPEELARVGRDYLAAMEHRYQDPAMAMAAYNAGPGAVDKALLHGANWLEHLPDETQKYVTKGMKKLGDQTVAHAAADPEAVDAARVRTTQDALHRSMPEVLEAPAEVMRASDALAAGETPMVREIHLDDPSLQGIDFGDGQAHPTGDLGTARPVAGSGEIVHSTVAGGDAPSGWAGATGIRGTNGEPTLLHRGSSEFLSPEHFDPENLGYASQNPSSGLGVFFTHNKAEAAKYGDVESAHLDIRNPKVIKIEDLPGFDTTAQATAYREKLRAAGHDGIIITAKHLGGETHVVAFDPHQVVYPPPQGAELGNAPTPRSEGTNSLPPPERATIEPEVVTKPAEPPKPIARAEKVAAESPDMLVQLPGSDRSVTVAEAMKQTKEQHALELTDTDLVKAALDCALGYGG